MFDFGAVKEQPLHGFSDNNLIVDELEDRI